MYACLQKQVTYVAILFNTTIYLDKVDDGNSTVNVLGLQWDTQTGTHAYLPVPQVTQYILKLRLD